MKPIYIFFFVVIFSSSTTGGITINYCCPPDTTYKNQECVDSNDSDIREDVEDASGKLENMTFNNFRFEIYLPTCAEDEIIVTVDEKELVTQEDSDYDYVDAPAVLDSGHLRFQESYYSRDEYCMLSIPSVTDHKVTIRVCEPTCTEKATCVPKCCLLNEVLQINDTPGGDFSQSCVPVTHEKRWTPIIYSDLKIPFGKGSSNTPVHIQLAGTGEWNMSECHNIALYPYKGPMKFDFRLLANGTVVYRGMNVEWKTLRGKFCIDGRADDGMFSGYENDTVILYCFPKSEVSAGANYTLGRWYYSVMIISAFFLVLTIIIYILLWEKHTIHGFSLLSYFIALLLMQLGFVSVFILSEQTVLEGNNQRINFKCLAFAVFAHFMFLHAFAWMTIVNFDLWCTFRNLKSSLVTSKGLHRYLKYISFAMGVPSIIVVVALTLDLKYGDAMPYERSLILPDYAKRKCYVSNPEARLPYIMGPVTALLFLNILFFISTICALRNAQEGTKLVRRSTPSGRQSIMLIAKLICVMGVPWIFEVISSAESLSNPGDVGSNVVPWYGVILDLVNHSQGIIIFIFFVCKQDIVKSLRTKFPCLNRACANLSKYIPCFGSKSCGSTNATILTVDSDNDGERSYALKHRGSANTKSTKTDTPRGSVTSSTPRSASDKSKSLEPLCKEKTSKV